MRDIIDTFKNMLAETRKEWEHGPAEDKVFMLISVGLTCAMVIAFVGSILFALTVHSILFRIILPIAMLWGLTYWVLCGFGQKELRKRFEQEKSTGYELGYAAGYANGEQKERVELKLREARDDNYLTGSTDGYNKGYAKGQDVGYKAGLKEGEKNLQEAIDKNYLTGREIGVKEGYEDGYEAGYEACLDSMTLPQRDPRNS